MDFITLLRKIGILRFGVKKYKYTSGRDMPVEALMDDVYDPEKDLVTKEDFKKVSSYLKKKITPEKTERFCTKCGQQVASDNSFCTKCGTAAS